MRSLLVIYNQATGPKASTAAASKTPLPETVLRACGYSVAQAHNRVQAKTLIGDAEASVLHVPLSDIREWGTALLQWKAVPLLWWCSDETAAESLEACEDNVMVDGILTPSMKAQEVHWALHFGAKQCFERQQWLDERKQLLSRIEERKWIDMAKGILCEIKNISEAEAYDLLRKQAMNERKRLVDVATSIVNVYQLLQEQKQRKGAKRP
ncbi:ANTAR domain-containing response regulator [Paenibacillus sp. GYB003]|uniref:ANTAR domain-containing response regulator n=1 Tax=Paenibacillus sp. GYB003 TaxID=2994392 RepID=UPI002F965AA5